MQVVQAATCDRCCHYFRQYQRAGHARRRARSASVPGISRLSADIKDVAVQSDPGLVWAYAPDGRTTPGSSDESGPPEAVLTEEDLRQHLRSMTTTVQSAQIPRVGGTQPVSVRFQHWPSTVAPNTISSISRYSGFETGSHSHGTRLATDLS